MQTRLEKVKLLECNRSSNTFPDVVIRKLVAYHFGHIRVRWQSRLHGMVHLIVKHWKLNCGHRDRKKSQWGQLKTFAIRRCTLAMDCGQTRLHLLRLLCMSRDVWLLYVYHKWRPPRFFQTGKLRVLKAQSLPHQEWCHVSIWWVFCGTDYCIHQLNPWSLTYCSRLQFIKWNCSCLLPNFLHPSFLFPPLCFCLPSHHAANEPRQTQTQ